MSRIFELEAPIPFRTNQAVVADRLRRAVLSGQLRPGARLFQTQIAQEMGTSTTPVREAMRELAGEGLLWFDPHRGVVVHQPSGEVLREVYHIRLLLEPVAIAATVRNISGEQIAKAEKILQDMDTEAEPTEWAIKNAAFHSLLAEASQMPILTPLLAKLRNVSMLYVASLMHLHPDVVQTAHAEHWAMLDACKQGQVDRAQKIEVRHLKHALTIGDEQLEGLSSGPTDSGP